MNLTTADTIVDLIVAELQTAITDEFAFGLPFTIAARDLPNFELIDATDETVIYVAAAPNVDLRRMSRANIEEKTKVGVAVLKRLAKDARGEPSTTEFRELKSLMQAIYQWAHEGVEGYEGRVSSVVFPAWYDFQKAIQGVFLSVVQVNYDVSFAE